jgi:hypothetical protein
MFLPQLVVAGVILSVKVLVPVLPPVTIAATVHVPMLLPTVYAVLLLGEQDGATVPI